MTDPLSDSSLDARLRDVPLPSGLMARLREEWSVPAEAGVAEAAEDLAGKSPTTGRSGGAGRSGRSGRRPRETRPLSDGELDERLRAVPLPDQLQARLREVMDQEVLDDRLRDVPLPDSLMARLRVVPWLSTPRRVRHWAVAASLMILIGGPYLAALCGLTWSLRPERRMAEREMQIQGGVVDEGPVTLRATASTAPDAPAEIAAAPEQRGARSLLDPPAIELERFSEPPGGNGPADAAFAGLSDTAASSPSGSWWTDVLLSRWQALGAPHADSEDLPTLDPSPLVKARGLEPPAEAEESRLVMLRYGTHPPVFVGRHEELARALVPLSAETESLERTRQLLSEQRLPRPREVRVEDFVAGLALRFAPPSRGPVALRTAAGPSIFGDPQAGLLLLGVQAGGQLVRKHPATHLTVAIDTSDSMRWGGRLTKVRAALLDLLDHLGPRDRLSVVLFDEEVWRVVEQAGREDAEALRSLFDDLRAGGGTNFGAGLQQAVSQAMEASLEGQLARQLVILTDGQALLPESTHGNLVQLIGEAHEKGLNFHWLDLGERLAVDPQMTELAAAAGTSVLQVGSATEARWRLLEALTGRPTVVAEEVTLRIEWNPAVVEAYRLIGHDATSLATLEPAEQSLTLRADQALATLVEVWLRPGSEDLVGWAELQWRPPEWSAGPAADRTGDAAAEAESPSRAAPPRKLRQRISRLQFAPSFTEAPLNLQAAAIAAETAEVLRESHYFRLAGRTNWDGKYGPDQVRPAELERKPDDWQHVLERAEQVSEVLEERPEFRRLVEMIQQLDRARRLRAVR